MSKWSEIKKFINKNKSFRMKHVPFGSTGKLYVNYLHKGGFLTRTKRGHYTLNLNLDENLTLAKVQDYAYGELKGQLAKVIRKEKLKKLNIKLSE